MPPQFPIRKRDRGKKPWQLDLREVGGGRLAFETKGDAELARLAKRLEFEKFGRSAMDLTAKDRLELLALREAIGSRSITDVMRSFVAGQKSSAEKSVMDALGECIAAKTGAGLDPSYLAHLESDIASLACPDESAPCSSLTRANIESWLNENGWAPRTRLGKLINVRTFFAFCVERGYTAVNPAEGIIRPKLDNKPPGILTPAQVRAILQAAASHRPHMIPYFALGLFAGVRPEEIKRLSSAQLQIDRGFVEIPAAIAKSRQRRIVDLSPNCVAWLRVESGLPIKNIWRSLSKVRTEASKLLGERFPWSHDCMRHSFASYHLAAHGSADRTALQMGHRSTDMLFRHYREIVTREQAAEFWGIGRPISS